MSEHWYDTDGNPAYTYINTKGEKADTTLREARKLNLWPSVTTIISQLGSSGLDNYRQQQLCLAAWDELKKSGMSFETWSSRVINQSKQHSKSAASKGDVIHNALETYFKSGSMLYLHADIVSVITPVVNYLEKEFPKSIGCWIPEKSFYSNHGFGGKVDMHDPVNNIVLDFKTKDTVDINKMIAYDSHHMQTAAYAVGLGLWTGLDGKKSTDRYNLFISSQTPGVLKLTKSGDVSRDWAMFKCLLDFWKISKKHNPRMFAFGTEENPNHDMTFSIEGGYSKQEDWPDA